MSNKKRVYEWERSLKRNKIKAFFKGFSQCFIISVSMTLILYGLVYHLGFAGIALSIILVGCIIAGINAAGRARYD
jgi:succinate dehydrogenase/fumarate reductase cytochrome b subunit